MLDLNRILNLKVWILALSLAAAAAVGSVGTKMISNMQTPEQKAINCMKIMHEQERALRTHRRGGEIRDTGSHKEY